MYKKRYHLILGLFLMLTCGKISSSETLLNTTMIELGKMEKSKLEQMLNLHIEMLNDKIFWATHNLKNSMSVFLNIDDGTTLVDILTKNQIGILQNAIVINRYNRDITLNEDNYIFSSDDPDIKKIDKTEMINEKPDIKYLITEIQNSTFLEKVWRKILEDIKSLSYLKNKDKAPPFIIVLEYDETFSKDMHIINMYISALSSFIIYESLQKYVQKQALANAKPKDISKNSNKSFIPINIYTVGIPAGCLFLLLLYFWYSKTSSNKI